MRVEQVDSGLEGIKIFAFTLDDGRRLNVDVVAPGIASVDWQIGVEIEGLGSALQSVAISPWLAYEEAVQVLTAQGWGHIDWTSIRAELDTSGAFPA